MTTNTIYIRNAAAMLLLIFLFNACSDYLEPVVYDKISGSSFYQTDKDADVAVFGLYSYFGYDVTATDATRLLMGEYGSDGFVQKDEAFNNLDWESDKGYAFHGAYFRAVPYVTSASSVLYNIEDMEFTNPLLKPALVGEARLARALVMFDLLNWYGPTAIVVDREHVLYPDNSYMPERMSMADYTKMLNDELTKAIEELPENNGEDRFNKNIARMVMLKYYMHQKNWEGAEQMSAQLMGKYTLEDNYNNNWNINTENGPEVIWSISRISNTSDFRNVYRMRSSHPKISKVTKESTWGGSGMDKYRFSYRNNFDPADERKINLIDTFQYVDKRGKTQYIILNQEPDAWGASPLKTQFDPVGVDDNGIDVVVFRYADVLLCRAEALNNLNGPNAESIELINKVRVRAKVKPIELTSFGSKEALNDHILAERGWEFWYEGFRCEDLIRHGKYISEALKRDPSYARDYMVLYSIPKQAYFENPNIKQNEGYKF